MIFLSGIMLFSIPWIEKKREETAAGEQDFEGTIHYVGPDERISEVDEDEEDDPDNKPMTMKT